LGSILGPLIGGFLLSSGISYVMLFLVMAVPALLAGCAFAAAYYLQSAQTVGSHPVTEVLQKGTLQ
jgi:AAHS family 4-hydroxybenzoate transporter-like MFS transporter